MKTRKFVVATVVALSMGNAQAALFDRGGGMIYDDELKITWLQDANYAQTSGYDSYDGKMNWVQANSWAASLVYGGYDDWRLPTTPNLDGSGRCDGYRCTNSEMGYMFSENMGAAAGGSILNGDSATNRAMFTNLQSGYYWSSSVYVRDPNYDAWGFDTHNGFQSPKGKRAEFYAWAVRPGDVAAPIPEPETYAMLLAGLGVMGGIARRRQGKG